MQQILKRLELIKAGIALEEKEVITIQTAKLSSMDVDETVSGILQMIANDDYVCAVREIDAYFYKYSGMMVYEDPELQGLRLELKSLESRVQSLTEQRDEYLFTIHEFNTRYTAALGDLIEKILRAKADRLREQIVEDSPDLDAQEAAYKKAEKEFREFREEADEIREEDGCKLSDNELAALKKAYRKASRLCHPDLVPDALKERAHEMMQQLNEAYKKRDLAQVQKILAAIESGNGFDLVSDTVTDKAVLKAKISALRNKASELADEVDTLQTDETFELLQQLDDWGEYFESIREQLSEEYNALTANQIETPEPAVSG